MEPGSADYTARMAKARAKAKAKSKLRNRDDGDDGDQPETHVTIGDHKILWGCNVDPVAEPGHLGDMCHTSGQCDDSSPYEKIVKYIPSTDGPYAGGLQDKQLTIKATGNYPVPLRNGLVQAIQNAAGADGVIAWHRGVEWFDQLEPGKGKRAGRAEKRLTRGSGSGRASKRETPAIADPHQDRGNCDVAELSTHIGLNVYSSPDTLEATMEATAEYPNDENDEVGYCTAKKDINIAGSISGALGAPGAVVAGFLGVIKAECK